MPKETPTDAAYVVRARLIQVKVSDGTWQHLWRGQRVPPNAHHQQIQLMLERGLIAPLHKEA